MRVSVSVCVIKGGGWGVGETDSQTDEKKTIDRSNWRTHKWHSHDGQKASLPGNNSRLHDSQFGHGSESLRAHVRGWADCRPIPDLPFCSSIQSFLCLI